MVTSASRDGSALAARGASQRGLEAYDPKGGFLDALRKSRNEMNEYPLDVVLNDGMVLVWKVIAPLPLSPVKFVERLTVPLMIPAPDN